jgi:hypothetical protein
MVLFLFKTPVLLVTNSVVWAQLSRCHLKTEQNPVFETLCVLNKNRTKDNVQKHNSCIGLIFVLGRAIAQAVSRWLPTAAARARVHAACGVCGGQGGTVAGFLRVLRFPLPIIPPISPSS